MLADRGGLPTRASLAVALGSLAVGFAARRRARLCAACACIAALGAGALALGVQREASRAGRPAHPSERTFEATILAIRSSGSAVFAVLDDVVPVDGQGPIPRRVSVTGEIAAIGEIASGLQRSDPGDRLRVRARLRAPNAQSNPGGRDEGREFERAGIGAAGSVARSGCCIRLPGREGRRWPAGLWRARREAGAQLEKWGEGGALLRALALGDRQGLSEATRDAFARVGLSHLLAVSGLHLSLVASLGFAFSRRVFRRSVALATRGGVDPFALAVGGLLALSYAILAGWGIPVRRALVLLGALALAVACGRPGARFHPLALAAMAILAREPEALFSAGAQLSFAACAALLAANAPQSEALESAPARALSRALHLSAVAIAATAPLAAWHMGRVAPFALLSNLVAIPWTAVVLLPASLGAALWAHAPEHPLRDAGLEAACFVARLTLLGIDSIARHLPALRTSPSPALATLGFAALLGVGVVRARGTVLRVGLVLLECAVLAVAPTSSLSPPAPRVIAIDVGQGDSTLLQGRTGAVLVDAGSAIPGHFDSGRSRVVPALLRAGLRRLDLLLVTHADLDHRGGIPAVIEALTVGELWVPFGAGEDEGFAPVFAAARLHGVPVFERGQGSTAFQVGDLAIEPLWPPRAPSRASRNDRSLVVRAEIGGISILLAGDLQRAGESGLLASGARLRADVLELPHHGSRTSSSPEFLEAVGASVAIVSAPCFGRFGMPHEEVVQRAARAGLTIWWTGRDGAVWLSPQSDTGAPAFAAWGHARDGPRCTYGSIARAQGSQSKPAGPGRYSSSSLLKR